MGGETNGQLDGRSHTPRIRSARSRDVERRAVIRGSPREGEAKRHIHSPSEIGHLDRRHSHIVVGRDHRIELAPERAHEDGIGRQRAGGTKLLRGGTQHPVVFIPEQTRFSRVRIEGAHGQSRPFDSPPRAQCIECEPSGSDNAVSRDQRGHVAERHVGRYQRHLESAGGQHHGDVDAAGQLGEPFRVARIWKTGKMERVLVGGSGDDGVYFSGESQFDGVFHSVAGNPARAYGTARLFIRFGCAPRAGRETVHRRDRFDLVFGSDDDYVGVEWIPERSGRDLGTDPPGIAQSDRDPWRHRSRISTYVPRRRRVK